MNSNHHLQELMAETGRAFMEHSMSDPTHEFGLLALSPYFPGGNGGDRWIAHHWTGKQMRVGPQPMPEGVDLRRVSGAVMSEDPTLNLALWYVGMRPGSDRLSIKMFAVAEDPAVLAEPNAWATRQIAYFADQSTEDGSGAGPDSVPAGRGGWLRRLVGRTSHLKHE